MWLQWEGSTARDLQMKWNTVAALSTSRKGPNVGAWSSVDGLRWNYYFWYNLAFVNSHDLLRRCPQKSADDAVWDKHPWLTHPHQISLQLYVYFTCSSFQVYKTVKVLDKPVRVVKESQSTVLITLRSYNSSTTAAAAAVAVKVTAYQ